MKTTNILQTKAQKDIEQTEEVLLELEALHVEEGGKSQQNPAAADPTEASTALKFENMQLHDDLLRGVFAYGFEKPSPIQQNGIPPLLARKDAILQAQSGTGKTGCFCIAALQTVDQKLKAPQVLLLSPTRELASQTFCVLSALNFYLKINCYLFVGGSQMAAGLKALRDGAQIAVGTPGRLCDLIEKRQLMVDKMRLVVLDEADQLLQQGFQEAMRYVISSVPASTQLCLCSATMPSEIQELSDRFLRNPVRILLEAEKVTLEGITQYYVQLEPNEKYQALCDIFSGLRLQQTIVYCNSRRTVDWLEQQMRKDDHVVSCIHADLEPAQRSAIMQAFRTGNSRVLISTDLTARGIDVQGVSLVMNFEIPRDRECYIHRIGRSGRYGRRGTAINFVSKSEAANLREIERHWKATLLELPSLEKIQL